MVRDLRTQGIQADASCSSMNKDEPLSRAAIERIVATDHADGVLATSLVSANWRTQKGGTYDTRSSGQYKYVASGYDTGFYGVYGIPVDYYQFKTQPSITNARGQVHVLTKLYDTRDAKLVYTIDTKVRDIESSQLGLAVDHARHRRAPAPRRPDPLIDDRARGTTGRGPAFSDRFRGAHSAAFGPKLTRGQPE